MDLSALELDFAVDQCEDRVVLALACIKARKELGAALTKDDRTSGNNFPAVSFNTQILRIRIAAVLGTTAALFMCHDVTSKNVIFSKSVEPDNLTNIAHPSRVSGHANYLKSP